MTRMARKLIARFPLGLLALVLAAPGCGPDKKDMKIEELTAENDQLKLEIDERDGQLNDALVREGDSRESIEELNRQIAQMRVEGEKTKDAEGWVTMPSFDMISIEGSVLFPSGKADLSSSGRSRLQQIASDIKSRYPDRDIYVFGHTDAEPIKRSKWKDNWELGAHRALSVVRTLQKLGIPNERLVQANCGQFRPQNGDTVQGRSRADRRVEFYAVRRGGTISENTTARSNIED